MSQPSLALVPPSADKSSSISIASTATQLGPHDTLRHGLRSLAADVAPSHPLKNRLENWEQTQETLQLTMQRNLYGLHMPVRNLMDRSILSSPANNAGLSMNGGFTKKANLGLEILMGKDEQIEIGDVLVDRATNEATGDFHHMMEKKLRMM
ncbi:proteasome maturation factor UMP1 [Pseudohyphozyma bogoriensis]|nr:proteasome maturation factor UMP1 [Pseudohyphozyma bogoriensis]